jgi:hypothetical protein
LQAQLESTPSMEGRRFSDTLENFPIGQIFFEYHVCRMSHSSQGDKAHTVHTSALCTQADTHSRQSHALRFPVSNRPRQYQRKLVTANLIIKR